MDETFTLVVNYKGKEYQLEGELSIFGYAHNFAVKFEGREILFEPDEERNYRAVMPGYDGSKAEKDIELVQAIAKELAAAFDR